MVQELRRKTLAVCEAGESEQSAGMAGVAEDADLGVGEACLLLDRGDLVIAAVEGESFLGEGALRVRGHVLAYLVAECHQAAGAP
jgi:hypothetical protein